MLSKPIVLNYYEEHAYYCATDREIIIGRGFQEWLLADAYDSSRETMAAFSAEYTPNHSQGLFRSHGETSLGLDKSELVTLIANMIGGGDRWEEQRKSMQPI